MASRAYYFAKKIIWLSSFLLITTVLPGCASMSKGVTLALLEKSEEPDTRKCEVWGKPFEGIEPRLAKEHGKTKILMVHGVADHIPGYTTQFQGKLAKELGLNARSAKSKKYRAGEPCYFPAESWAICACRALQARKMARRFYFMSSPGLKLPGKKKSFLLTILRENTITVGPR